MKFRFDANQEFQIRAIEAVTDLFDGRVQGTRYLIGLDRRVRSD